MNSTYLVPFCHSELTLIDCNGEPYVAMKPIVDGMGLDWASQFRKLNNKFKACIVKMTIQLPNDTQAREVVLMALKKLPAWLYSIEPNKVKAELRAIIVRYQEECDEVLWQYWTTGVAVRKKVQAELDEWRKKNNISFEQASTASKQMHARKKEKKFLLGKIQECERLLVQPDLFTQAA